MKTLDITPMLEAAETPQTRAYEHALDIEFAILEAMNRQGISREELAEKMGVSELQLECMLNMQPDTTLETIAKLGLALGARMRMSIEEQDSN